MRRQRIQEGWKGFEAKVLPPNVGEAQRADMRGAFFAGALVVFATLESQVSAGEEITPEDMSLMEDIDSELRAFGEEAKRRADAYRRRGQG